MNVTYICPACHVPLRSEFDCETRVLACTHCHKEIVVSEGAVRENHINSCLVCPSTDLFVRKDFPQRLGVLIVTVGIVGSSIAWYHANLVWTFGILFATALIDVLLYLFVGDALMCYRCQAQYRGVEEMDSHGSFDLETHERYRQLDARLNRTREPMLPQS